MPIEAAKHSVDQHGLHLLSRVHDQSGLRHTAFMSHKDRFVSAVERGEISEVRRLLADDPALTRMRDSGGATALHHAAFHGHRQIVELLLDAGADINARDATHNATPAGWAIEYLRERGGLLAIEIEDLLFAIMQGDVVWARRLLTRHPALAKTVDRNGTALAAHAARSSDPEMARLFEGAIDGS